MEIPPNPPVDNLIPVNYMDLKPGDKVYVYTPWTKWKSPGVVREITVSSPTITYIDVEHRGQGYSSYGKGPGANSDNSIRFFKRSTIEPILEEKYLRQKQLALKNSAIGFEGQPMNTIGKMLGLKKLPPGTLRERRRRRKSRKSRRQTRRRR